MSATTIATVIASILVALITSLVTVALQERRLRFELRTEFMAERAIQSLLQSANWSKRSFAEIKKRIGGFDDDELRRLLVRAGAVRFESQERGELWGLVSRNEADV